MPLSPLTWLLVAAALSCLAITVRRGRRRLCVAAAGLAACALLAMTPLFANLLLAGLERDLPAPAACADEPPRVAVVLAGGVTGPASSASDDEVLGLASRRRMDRGIAWWREDPAHRRLVLSGGPARPGDAAESALLAAYASRLGVPRSALAEEAVSTTTRESAHALSALRPPLPSRVVLVTSASHMPRARFAMSEAGFDVCPLPADRRRVPLDGPGILVPQQGALEKSEIALHELVGMAWYRWLAWRARAAA